MRLARGLCCAQPNPPLLRKTKATGANSRLCCHTRIQPPCLAVCTTNPVAKDFHWRYLRSQTFRLRGISYSVPHSRSSRLRSVARPFGQVAVSESNSSTCTRQALFLTFWPISSRTSTLTPTDGRHVWSSAKPPHQCGSSTSHDSTVHSSNK